MTAAQELYARPCIVSLMATTLTRRRREDGKLTAEEKDSEEEVSDAASDQTEKKFVAFPK